MIAESLRDSKWAPYLAILPRQLDSLVFWSQSELAELQASSVVNKIGKEMAEETFVKQIAPLGLGNCDTEMCHLAASAIMAYAFDIPDEEASKDETNAGGDDDSDDLVSDDGADEKTTLSMIPLADMLNADAERNNARLCCAGEDLEMRTIKPISRGEEIFNDYGQLPRADLLRRYGYVTEGYAIYDVAEISTAFIMHAFRSLGADQIVGLELINNEDIEKRVELAEREGILEDSYNLAHPGSDGPSIPDDLLAVLYLLLVDKESLDAIENSNSSLPGRSKLATELVGEVLVVILRMREKQYSTTLEEDERILQKGNIAPRTTMAVQVRLGEKRVLREAMQEANSFTGSNKRMRVAQTSGTELTARNENGKRRIGGGPNPNKKGRLR
jgi:SET domain-containing protein 6